MIEFMFMVVFTVAFWLTIICPCLLSILFGYSPSKYKEAVTGSIYFTGVVGAIFLFVIAFVLVVMFLSGDINPISTLISRVYG